MTPAESLLRLQNDNASAYARLGALEAELAAAHAKIDVGRTALLVEANAELLTAALRAQGQVDAAANALREAARAAATDALTGLPNRVLFTDRLTQAISRARRDNARLAVLFIDLDGLKQVNDEFGHPAGDLLLKHVAQALRSVVRESDSVSRHGGDEFLVLLPAVADNAAVAALAQKALAAIGLPCRIGGRAFSTSASIGISVFPESGRSAAELIANADAAMVRAKRQRRGSVVFDSAPAWTTEAVAQPAPATRRADSELLLRDTNERLLLTALQQTDFMAMVAHEFRNPLAAISNAASLLVHPKAGAGVVDRVGPLLARQVMQLSRLAGDLMNATTGGSERFSIQLQRLDLGLVIESAIEACRPALESRRQTLQQDAAGGPWLINGDPVRLAQVLRNLLDNARKYTPEGGLITVSLRGRGKMIEVSIADNGIGLAPTALDSVFDMFAQEERAAEYNAGGVGVGLAVARQLVQAQGGHIAAHSAGPGLGSEFVFSLPRAD